MAGLLVHKSGEVSISYLLDPSSKVVELEHQQLGNGFKLSCTITISRLDR